MKKCQVTISTPIKNGKVLYVFGKTKAGDKVYVPLKAATTVKRIQKKGSKPLLNEKGEKPHYYLEVGDVIYAHLVTNGHQDRLVAELWAPLGVCKGEKPKIHMKKKVRHNLSSFDSGFQPATGLSILIGELLDENEKGQLIRVRPPEGKGQIFFGPISTLLKTETHASKQALSNSNNVFELLQHEGQDKVIWPYDNASVA